MYFVKFGEGPDVLLYEDYLIENPENREKRMAYSRKLQAKANRHSLLRNIITEKFSTVSVPISEVESRRNMRRRWFTGVNTRAKKNVNLPENILGQIANFTYGKASNANALRRIAAKKGANYPPEPSVINLNGGKRRTRRRAKP